MIFSLKQVCTKPDCLLANLKLRFLISLKQFGAVCGLYWFGSVSSLAKKAPNWTKLNFPITSYNPFRAGQITQEPLITLLKVGRGPPASKVVYLHKYFQIFDYFISQDSKNVSLSCCNTIYAHAHCAHPHVPYPHPHIPHPHASHPVPIFPFPIPTTCTHMFPSSISMFPFPMFPSPTLIYPISMFPSPCSSPCSSPYSPSPSTCSPSPPLCSPFPYSSPPSPCSPFSCFPSPYPLFTPLYSICSFPSSFFPFFL